MLSVQFLFNFLDELQYINITGCDPTLTAASRTFVLTMPNNLFTPTNITLLCDASDTVIRSTILAATAIDVHVAVKSLNGEGGSSVTQVIIFSDSNFL